MHNVGPIVCYETGKTEINLYLLTCKTFPDMLLIKKSPDYIQWFNLYRHRHITIYKIVN